MHLKSSHGRGPEDVGIGGGWPIQVDAEGVIRINVIFASSKVEDSNCNNIIRS